MCEYKVDKYLVRVPNKELMNTWCVKCLSERNHKLNSFIKEFQCLKSSSSVLMDLECPLLEDRLSVGFADVLLHSPSFWKGHSYLQFSFHLARRWRRWWRAWWEKTNSSGLVTGKKRVAIGRRVRRLPGCRKCLHSSGVSISATVLKAPVTAGFIYRHVLDWLPPLLQGC